MQNAAVLCVALVFASGLAVIRAASPEHGPPAWAYPVGTWTNKPAPDDNMPRHVAGSIAAFSVTQSRNRFFTLDWHPADHPPMPDIVAYGKKPDAPACGFCHRAEGSGGPENANIAGLPAAYAAQQLQDFRTGARKNPVPARLTATHMITVAKVITAEEEDAAIAYFAAIKPRAAIRVVETETVPKTKVEGERLAVATGLETEPIGERIIEVPENEADFLLHDGWARFVAYVPPGSVRKGEALVAAADGKTNACGTCHGSDLKGLGAVPAIAGRSPSYIVRQLYDLQTGVRAGGWSPLMQPVVENLSLDDMIALAAYAASLGP
jgi:cytochrome c553